MTELADKIALVTGASRGIGQGIAHQLASAGARVAVVARSADRAAASAAALPGDGHGSFACDVSDPAAVGALLEAVAGSLGPVGILVNNAGITADDIVARLSDDAWDRVLRTNLGGAFHTTRAVARGMMRRREGRIVNVTSVVGLTGNRGQANYAASKAGLIGFTKSVARELASRGVACNAIAPGYIDTEMTQSLPEEVRERMLGQIPLGRFGSVQDVAAAVRFLVGPAAGYITGQVLVVDGGMVM